MNGATEISQTRDHSSRHELSERNDMDRAQVAQLRDRTRGQVLLAGDDGFDARCAGFQTHYRHRPTALVRAADPGDVAAAVSHASAHAMPVAVQATGHGLSVAAGAGALLIRTDALRSATIDAPARTAYVGAGARFTDVIAAAARYGLAPLNGSAPGVGVTGYVLGGGLPLLAREFGYAADHVLAVDVITADGQQRRVTAASDPELFWALRGGGGNFGAVTGMEINLVRVSRLYGGELTFDLAHTPDLLADYLRWTETLPESLTSSVSLVNYPELPAFPAALRGRYVAHVRVAYTGDGRLGEELLAPLRALGRRLSDTVAEMPYTECARIYNDPPMPHAYLGDNVLVNAMGQTQAAEVTKLAGSSDTVPSIVDVRHLGGALSRSPAVENAVGHRGARYLLRVLTPLLGTPLPEVRETQDRILGVLQAESVGGRLQNLVYGGFGGEGAAAAPAEDFWEPAALRRLAALKTTYDPANLFRFNRNVLPAG